jgi:hypothetical protein
MLIGIIFNPVALEPQYKEYESKEGQHKPDAEQQGTARCEIGAGEEDLVEEAAWWDGIHGQRASGAGLFYDIDLRSLVPSTALHPIATSGDG